LEMQHKKQKLEKRQTTQNRQLIPFQEPELSRDQHIQWLEQVHQTMGKYPTFHMPEEIHRQIFKEKPQLQKNIVQKAKQRILERIKVVHKEQNEPNNKRQERLGYMLTIQNFTRT